METERECSEKEELMQPPKKKARKKQSPIRKVKETGTSNILKETLNNEPTCNGEEGDIERTDDTSTVIESDNESVVNGKFLTFQVVTILLTNGYYNI